MRNQLPHIILFLFIIVAFIVGAIFFLDNTDNNGYDRGFNEHTIYVHDDIAIHVIVADTAIERQTGLGQLEMIATNHGMLFIFKESKQWRIWMKTMKFGIDIIWLDENGKVVDIKEYAYPNSYPEVFEPKLPARYILEVLVGFVGANGIVIGDTINLQL